MLYDDFLKTKAIVDKPVGFEPDDKLDGLDLFDFQKAITRWSCLRGKGAIFADTGLGKTRMQLAWADQVNRKYGSVLILAPLCVANQTVQEGKKIGINVEYIREPKEGNGIFITNYDLLHLFKDSLNQYQGIVLDESSIIKHQTSKTRNLLIKSTRKIKFRLSCTATPSPNDYMELGNQCEFLGIMKMEEMLSMFFTHDGGNTSKWRLKGHGIEKFWEWLSHWAVFIKKPSDIGYNDDGYILPELIISEIIVKTGKMGINGRMIAKELNERNQARKATIKERVKIVSDMVNTNNEQFIVWCNLNEESEELSKAIPDAVEVRGSQSLDEKEEKMMAFTEGRSRVIISKPSISGFGVNWQHCHNMAFVGLNDSYEQLYQAIRRCYRFGQKSKVNVYLISADIEGEVLNNIKRKEKNAQLMQEAIMKHMSEFVKREVKMLEREESKYQTNKESGEGWGMMLGDSVEEIRQIPSNSIHFSVFSPPFSNLYTYSNSERDMGNSKNDDEFWIHFNYLIKEIYRIMMPGRVVSVHCMNLPSRKSIEGFIGIKDFRGEIIRNFTKSGFIYHSEVCIWKDPVVAMQRTKALGLLWKQIKKDSAMCRQGIPDYVVTFRKLGENPEPVSHESEEFPVDEWQRLASPCWYDIKQTNTLSREGSKTEEDEKHICPLQLDVIQRCIRLWSKKGDVVFSPFAGIGSEGYVARKMNRRFIGIELKESYFNSAVKNISMAIPDPQWERCDIQDDILYNYKNRDVPKEQIRLTEF